MKCSNCSAENGANDKFCAYCGMKLTGAAEPPAPVAEPAAPAPPPPPVQPAPPPQAVSVPPKKKGRPLVFILVGLVAVAVITAGSVFAYSYVQKMSKTPEQRLAEAMVAMMESEKGEVQATISVEDLNVDMSDADAAMVGDLLRDMVLVSHFRYDIEKVMAEGDMNLEMMGTSLIAIDFYVDAEQLMVDIPLMYDQPLYITIEDLAEMLQGPMLDSLMFGAMMGDYGDITMTMDDTAAPTVEGEQITDAIQIVVGILEKDQYNHYDTVDRAPYYELITAYITEVSRDITEAERSVDGSNLKGYEFQMASDREEASWLIQDILEEMAEDPEVTLLLEEVIGNFFDAIIEQENYILYSAVMESDIEGITAWESSFAVELEDKKAETIKELQEGMKNAKYEVSSLMEASDFGLGMDMAGLYGYGGVTGDSTLFMDRNGVIHSQESIMDMDLSVMDASMDGQSITMRSETIYMNMDGEVSFDGVDMTKVVDIGAMNEEELMTLFMEVQTNLTENLMNNPMLSDLFNMGF